MSAAIGVAESPEGALAYAIPFPPEATPPVRPQALLEAWAAARAAAGAGRYGPARRFLFLRGGGEEPLALDLADPDARCWAEAVDAASPLDRAQGLALCLRLLALIDLLGRASWTRGLFVLDREGAEFHPALLAAAATAPLDATARFDAALLRERLTASLPARTTRP
ncbi:MAG: hypothetical protein NZM27_00645 [Acetobacteraceae bacterium]|nr:hypothetical protein [Acetobacteraceae bacterium]MCX7686290.1 hypothetical protein [Acetobacteraceae bacterium]MDW8398576.1 hypothetical protein [Acetobacteraceae bacterium]